MVLAFLRAEFRSARFGGHVRNSDGTREFVEDPHLDNAVENATRKCVLANYRGYGRNIAIFSGFPTDVKWLRVAYTVDEIGEMLYAKYHSWVTLSGGTRRVKDGAANVLVVQAPEDINRHIIAVQHRVAAGERFPELILAAETEDSVPIVVEGHTRATAYVRALPADAEVKVLVGVSQGLRRWAFA